MLRKQVAVLLALLFAAANASIFSANLTSTGCADPDAFLKCQTAASAKSMDCFHHAGAYGQRSGDCFCAMSIDYYNCYAASCWNRAYECEYQQFIMAYLLYCTPAKLPVPYFPAPKDAADACSCNFGQVYQDFRDSMAQGLACMKKVNETGGNAEKLAGCKCCQISGMKSSIWETCPGVFPVDVGSDVVDGAAAQLNKPFSECSAITKSSCASDFGFSLGGVSTYLAPDQMTVTPAGSPTNKPGAVTTPASGATFTYTNGGDNSTYTITAAAFTGKVAVSSATTSDASGDATASASGAQKTGSKNAGMQVKPSFVLAAAFPLLALLL